MSSPERPNINMAVQQGVAVPEEITGLPGRTAPDAPTQPKRKKTEIKIVEETSKPRIGRKTRIALASLGVATIGYTGGAIVNEQINDQPVSAASIRQDLVWPWDLGKSTVEDVQRILGRGEVHSTFDNKAGKTRFGENNVKKITPEEAKSKNLLEPKVTVDNTGTVTVVTLLPGIFPSLIPDTQIDSKNDAGNPENAPFATKFFIMPEGFQLPIPKGTHYVLLKGQPEANQDPNLIYTIMTFLYDPVSGKSIGVSYESNGLIPVDGEKTFDRRTYNQLYNPAGGGKLEDLPLSDGIKPVARPASPNQGLYVNLFSISGSDHTNLSIGSFNKVKWENSVDSSQKLLVLSPR